MLTRVDCDAKGAVFQVSSGERTLKLRAVNLGGLHITAFSQEAGGQIGCGPRKPESHVVVTYRPARDARAAAKTDGDLVALEFVPAAFVLKQ